MRILLLVHTAWVVVMLALALAILALLPRSTNVPVPQYDVIDLGIPSGATSFQPVAISPDGYCIVGYARSDSASDGASVVLWRDGAFRRMSSKSDYEPLAVNDAGVVVGISYFFEFYDAVVWKDGTVEYLFPRSHDSDSVAIDRAGNIWGNHGGGEPKALRAYRRKPDGSIIDLDDELHQYSILHGVNQKNQAVLTLFEGQSGNYQVVIRDSRSGKYEHVLSALPDTRYCRPIAIGDNGDVVGSCGKKDGNSQPLLWKNGQPKLLPTPPIKNGSATSINQHGDIVGIVYPGDYTTKIPFLIRQGKFYDLEALTENHAKLTPLQILNDGTILADTTVGKEHHAFLLKPR